MGVHHITSSLHYHQSNAQAEEYVQLVKSFLSKAKETGENPHFACHYTGTPLGNGLYSPMELLCVRQAGSDLPISHVAGMQVGQVLNNRPLAEAIRPSTKNQVQASSSLLPLATLVMHKLLLSKLWYPDIVTSVLQYHGSYITATDGATYKYVRFHFRPYKPYKPPHKLQNWSVCSN